MKYWIFTYSLFSYLTGNLQAQMLSNQGALISIKGDALVAVHGNTINEQDGSFHNSNNLHLFGDWENNASNEGFSSQGEGLVVFQGDEQRIKGSTITRFYDLRFTNTGIKYADLDVFVDGTLDLTDRLLQTDTNTIQVFNPALNAVTHSLGTFWGMIASEGDGGLLRHTNQAQAYFYPVGGDLGTLRFRPVRITPSSNDSAAYKVRMANIDATSEGFDRSLYSNDLCNINPYFYHRISRLAGNNDAEVGIFYEPAVDDTYDLIAQWSGSQWALAEEGTNSTDTTYNLSVLTSNANLNSFSPNPFALAKPGIVANISPDTLILEGSSANLYASGGDFYNWTPSDVLDCSICDEVNASPSETTPFVVEIENLEGCILIDTVLVEVQPNIEDLVFIPNVLTPNNDGKNDTWFIPNIQNFENNSVRILNRWGDVVFEASNYQNNFEGRFAGGNLPAGTYYYVLDLGGDWGVLKGPVTIIRE